MIKHRTDIDGLRSVAIIPVVLFHVGFGAFTGGFVGVDVFFVISGYLITGLIFREAEQSRFSIIQFYERRIRRIFPALFAVLCALAIAAPFLLLPQDVIDVGKSIVATTLYFSNVLFWRQAGYFDAPAGEKFLLHTWSLSVEEQFYILFPLGFVWLVARLQRRSVVLVLAAAAAFSFACSLFLTYRHPIAGFYLPISRAWELLLGSIAAVAVVPLASNRIASEILAAVGIALIGIAIFTVDSGMPFPGFAALLPCLGSVMILQAGSASTSTVGRILSSRPLVFVGLISYSLYLWHWPIIVLFKYTALRSPQGYERYVLVALAVAVSTLSWKYIESPLRNRTVLPGRKAIFAAAAAVMLAAVCFGSVAVLGKGWPGRLPADVVATLAESGGGVSRYLSLFCGDLSAESVAAGKLCPLGSAGQKQAPDFILWGDSHAAALARAVDAEATRHGSSGVGATRLGCAPVLGMNRVDAPDRQCAEFNQAVLDYIDRSRISKVILAGQWAIYSEGDYYKIGQGHPIVISPKGYQDNKSVFLPLLDDTLRALAARKVQVFVVADVPEVGLNVPSTLAKARLWHRDIVIGPTRAQYMARQAYIFGAFSEMQDKYKLDVLFPAAEICSTGVCRVDQGGQPLYLDDNHLSRLGALSIADVFAPVFDDGSPANSSLRVQLQNFQ